MNVLPWEVGFNGWYWEALMQKEPKQQTRIANEDLLEAPHQSLENPQKDP